MIAVTGANGLLGSFIVRKLYETNTPFIAICRKNSDTSLLSDIRDTITWRHADINDPLLIEEALEGVTGVIHTAAMVSFNPRKKDTIFQCNTEGTKTIVNTCLIRGIKRLLHVSSVAALGRQKGQAITNETNKWIESSLNSVYGKSKYLAELEVFRGQEEGLSTVIVNPSVILAPANWNNSSARLFKYVWSEKSFYIDGSLNYVDVRDVADAIFQLYHASIEGERFILSAGNIPFKIFFDKLGDSLHKRSPNVKLNKTFLHIIARLEHLRAVLTGADPLITKETARLADTFFLYDNQKVKKTIGFEFQSIDDTLEWCCQYYRQLNAIKNK
jgi:dihydroflavonol-4-reductase